MKSHGRAGEYLDGVLDADAEAAFLAHLAGCVACQDELHAELQLRDREELARDASHAAVVTSHGMAGAYLDGDLDAPEEEVFLTHLASCPACQRSLHDEVQLRDREDTMREARGSERPAPPPLLPAPRSPDEVVSSAGAPRHPRRRGLSWPPVATLLAAGVVAAVAWGVVGQTVPAPDPGAALARVLRPTRGIATRLAYLAAARHRPYDTTRSSATPSEPIPPAVIAQLDAAHDCRGVAAAYVLAGAWELADQRYLSCPGGLDLDADRAGLAVLRDQSEDALELTERVLDASPDHTVALWNRALALRALGLGLTAAAAFERIAVLERSSEPAWAQEASARAAESRAELDRMSTDYLAIERLGKEMARGGPPLDAALAVRVPGRARIWLHNALRTATTVARVDELAPLAAALDPFHGGGLSRYVAQARARQSPARTAAAAAYRRFVVDEPGVIDDQTWKRWLAAATRSGLDDLILGARLVTRRLDGEPSADRLAAATHDPWFERTVELARVEESLDAGRVEEGAARLAAMQPHCPPDATSFRCLQLAVMLAGVEITRDQPWETMRQAVVALSLSRRLGEWPQRVQALEHAGVAQQLGGNLASARGYLEEAVQSRLRMGQHCRARVLTFKMAERLYQRHRFAQAAALAASSPACDEAPSTIELFTLTRLLRSGHPVIERAALLEAIQRARAAASSTDEEVSLDFLVAWLALDDDLGARDRLAQLATTSDHLEGAPRVKAGLSIDGALFADAARRGTWVDALAIVARARGVTPPSRCALGFGADDFRFAVVAIGPDGAITGRYEPDLARTDQWLAPAEMRRTLAACDEVAVLSLPPWLGIGPVLDASTSWRYVLGPPPPGPVGPARHLVITDPAPPSSAGLAPLVPRTWPSGPAGPDEVIRGASATPEHVLAEIVSATLVEIHSHAISPDPLNAPMLALSPGARGWLLDAGQIAGSALRGAPVVVLADCSGGVAVRIEHQIWGLPLAFRTAGAMAVIASLSPIPDRDAATFFDAVVAEIKRGVRPASAVAHVRAEKARRDPTSWVQNVVVFQ